MLFIMKKVFVSIIFILLLSPVLALAQDKVNVYFFESETCPHCAEEKAFLEKLKLEIPQMEVHDFEITKHPENVKLLQAIGKKFSIDVSSVPLTIIGSQYFPGYADDATTGQDIKNAVEECLVTQCEDLIAPLIIKEIPQDNENKISQKIPEKIKIPFFGETAIKNLSLPLLTLVIAGIDGFNPCAMWVLIFLISLLLGMKNRKRMWILGGTFIFTSGLVYFLFLSAWLNLFLFIGFIFWVRITIGLVAIASGVYYLKKYFTNRATTCPVSESDRQKKIFDKLKNITQKEQFWIALVGIILLAAAVNLVELICSAGLPAIYTSVIAMSDLSSIQYYSYLAFYIFVFMLDDLIIFIIAMVTLKTVGFTKKYSNASAFIGGILITIIGILLLFKPEWLMFN